MSAQAERDELTQRGFPRATTDLFAAFAASLFVDGSGAMAGRFMLSALVDIDNALALKVLNEIFAERRRRMSAATREERRAG